LLFAEFAARELEELLEPPLAESVVGSNRKVLEVP
jgi:hypothetical protein